MDSNISADIMHHEFKSANIGRVRASCHGNGSIPDSGIDIVPVPSVLVTTRPIRIGIGDMANQTCKCKLADYHNFFTISSRFSSLHSYLYGVASVANLNAMAKFLLTLWQGENLNVMGLALYAMILGLLVVMV